MNNLEITHDFNLHPVALEKLYLSAFPEAERRDFHCLRTMLKDEKKMSLEIIIEARSFCGFCVFWNFDKFYYIEHLALADTCRGKGIGSWYLKTFTKKIHEPVLLEVEPEIDLKTRKRILFYYTHGFEIIEKNYLQEPYRQGGIGVPLWIMSNQPYGQQETARQIEIIKQQVYRKYQ